MSRSESLFYSVALLSVSAVFFRILFVGSRLARERWWVRERWLCDIWMPLLVILFAFSVDFAIAAAIGKGAFFGNGTFALYAAAAIAIAVTAWVLLGRLLPATGHPGSAHGPGPANQATNPGHESRSREPLRRRAA